ncbi:MAG: nitrous oxide reductase family maturation protein NosD [Gemmatimonadota bacterium]
MISARLVVAAGLALAASVSGGTAALAQEQGQAVLRVGGPGAAYSTVSEALQAAAPGDTISVGRGTYQEQLVITKPVVMVGEGWPVIDGARQGHVIEAHAPITLTGFIIRGSGKDVDAEDSGLLVHAGPARVEHNSFEDVFYGIYLKDAGGSSIVSNSILGKDLPMSRRGDGIRLWHSSGTRIADNEVTGTRDVVIFFSDSLSVVRNTVTGGRYGLHYMYSNHNRFEENTFANNQVGAFIMYSSDIELTGNVFAEAMKSDGYGIGLKDADDIRITDNLMIGNGAGIYLDNSPSNPAATNAIERNVLAGNSSGVTLLPSVQGNEFRGNDFVDNSSSVLLSGGGGSQERNTWIGNYWSGYSGFDTDGDGVGDTPFSHSRLADELMSASPSLQWFRGSPVVGLLGVLSRFFPLLRPQPVLTDQTPRLKPGSLAAWRGHAALVAAKPPFGLRRALWLVAFATLSVLAGAGMGRVLRPRSIAGTVS